MYSHEIAMIHKILKKRGLEHLICDYLYSRSYEAVLEILNLPEWQKDEFKPLLTTCIWQRSANEIQAILALKAWKQDKFRPLLTSNIWNSNLKDIKTILELEAWNNPDFQPLLTSNIWNSNPNHINDVLTMPYWKKEIYKKLLTSTIWSISPQRISAAIEKYEELELETYIKTNDLRKSPLQIQTIYDYLIDNHLNVVVEDKLNPIFRVTPSVLKKKYGIDLKNLTKTQKRKIKS